jgi:autotransporter-associated beta strand protein
MGSVVKNLSGTLTLRGTNTYLGGTTINAGTLRIDGSSSLNNGDYMGSITNNGILRYSSSTPQYLRGTYSGSGTLSDDTSNLNFI